MANAKLHVALVGGPTCEGRDESAATLTRRGRAVLGEGPMSGPDASSRSGRVAEARRIGARFSAGADHTDVCPVGARGISRTDAYARLHRIYVIQQRSTRRGVRARAESRRDGRARATNAARRRRTPPRHHCCLTVTLGPPSGRAALGRTSKIPFVKSRCIRVARATSLPIIPSNVTKVHRCSGVTGVFRSAIA